MRIDYFEIKKCDNCEYFGADGFCNRNKKRRKMVMPNDWCLGWNERGKKDANDRR